MASGHRVSRRVARVLAVVPVVHHRAVRLTTRKFEDMIPSSVAEIAADKDLLRAELAMFAELDERSLFADKQTKELVALKAYVGALKERLDEAESELHAADERRAADRLELDSAIQQVMEDFHNTVSELVEQLLQQGIEDKNLARRTRELETRLAEQSQLLEASELERKRLREEIEVALKTEAERRNAVISEIDEHAKAETPSFKPRSIAPMATARGSFTNSRNAKRQGGGDQVCRAARRHCRRLTADRFTE